MIQEQSVLLPWLWQIWRKMVPPSHGNLYATEINQIELNKMGIIEVIIRLLGHEDLDVRRQSVTVLSSLFPNGKIRAKIRNSPECLQLIIKLLQVDDEPSIINASECIFILAEDRKCLCSNVGSYLLAGNRSDFIKNGAINALLVALEKTSYSVQSTACLALARCLQDGLFFKFQKINFHRRRTNCHFKGTQ